MLQDAPQLSFGLGEGNSPLGSSDKGHLVESCLYPDTSVILLKLVRRVSHGGLRCFFSSCDHKPGEAWAGGHITRSLDVQEQPNGHNCINPLANVGKHCLALKLCELFQGSLIKDLPFADKLVPEGPPDPALALSGVAWSLRLSSGCLDTQAVCFGLPEVKREPVPSPWSFRPGKEPSHPGRSRERSVLGWLCVGKGAAKFLVLIQPPKARSKMPSIVGLYTRSSQTNIPGACPYHFITPARVNRLKRMREGGKAEESSRKTGFWDC